MTPVNPLAQRFSKVKSHSLGTMDMIQSRDTTKESVARSLSHTHKFTREAAQNDEGEA